jgi:transcriptional regulator with XRE-family HTH domain
MINVDNVTQEHLTAGVQWISKMSSPDCWNLTDKEVARLLGIEPATFSEIQRKARNGEPLLLTNDSLERLSLLLGIWKGLNLFAPHQRQDLAFEWFSKPTTNATFNNRSIKDFLLERADVESFCEVITYLRAQH